MSIQFPPFVRPAASSILVAVASMFSAIAASAAEHEAPPAKPMPAASAKPEMPDKHAADKADKDDKPAMAEKKAVPEKGKEVEAAMPATLPRPRVVREPMDVIRERLAEKLGNPKAAEPAGDHELHVVTNVAMTSAGHAANAINPAIAPNASGAAVASIRPRARRAVHPPMSVPMPKIEKMTPMSEAPRDANWDYQGLGNPDTWSQLKPEFAKCGSGMRQSPIDIRDGIKVQLDPVLFAYRESSFSVIDNGHTVQVNVSPGSSIEVMGHRYDLVQFDFHRPSEERVNGRQFDMSVHLIHKDADGHLAIVAVELDRGSVQPIVQKVWNNLPLEKGETVAARSPLDVEALLPQDRRYFTYMGSLTAPPCSEGVLWMVMKQPVEVSAEQIGIFARLYPMNARPIQQASGRLIKESN